MKKLLGIALAGFLLLVPIVVSATPIVTEGPILGSIGLEITVTSEITGGGYYTDYQAFVNDSDKEVELFCVENEPADLTQSVNYNLYALDTESLTNRQAAWIAETYWNVDDEVKGQAQLAIWDLLDTIAGKESIASGNTGATLILDEVLGFGDTFDDFTGNWLLASNVGNPGAQDYLMRVAPVPEPATLILLGTGLIGLAGVSRKKFKK